MCLILSHHSWDFNPNCQTLLFNESQPGSEGRYSLLIIDVYCSFHIHIDKTFLLCSLIAAQSVLYYTDATNGFTLRTFKLNLLWRHNSRELLRFQTCLARHLQRVYSQLCLTTQQPARRPERVERVVHICPSGSTMWLTGRSKEGDEDRPQGNIAATVSRGLLHHLRFRFWKEWTEN